jgi:hypothetical protein
MSYDAYGKVKEASVAFGSVNASYANLVTETEGHFFLVKNGTDKDLVLKLIAINGNSHEITLPASDLTPRIYPIAHKGVVQLKYASAAPTSGSIFFQSFPSGLCL